VESGGPHSVSPLLPARERRCARRQERRRGEAAPPGRREAAAQRAVAPLAYAGDAMLTDVEGICSVLERAGAERG
jgi:hypothetical protein